MSEDKKPPVPTNVENKAELEVIRKKFNVTEDRFYKGVAFVNNILDGKTKTEAYALAAGCDKPTARKNAGSLQRAKWIQELQRFLTPDDNTLYVGEIKSIIQTGMEIINDRGASNRDKTEAIKALQPYIKAAKLDIEMTEEIKVSVAESTTLRLKSQIGNLVEAGKMVDENGDVIDVDVIE